MLITLPDLMTGSSKDHMIFTFSIHIYSAKFFFASHVDMTNQLVPSICD